MILSMHHSLPNSFVSSLRFSAAAARMLAQSSESQVRQRVQNFSWKNDTPRVVARRGTSWMMARRTLHLPSSARSITAGRRDWESRERPTTALSLPRPLIRRSRTSESSSLSRASMMGRRPSVVPSLPKTSAIPVIAPASSPLTPSTGSSLTFPIASSTASLFASLQTPTSWLRAAMRTSDSESDRRDTYSEVRLKFVREPKFEATVQRTLQLRSVMQLLRRGRMRC
mmetsp:Transcript_29015/g.57998  ORF Transcript_29015/g.57998 Transcript_29015/m.57998 type:complete len:227 (-) Transcript_29015:944-1624(-)